MTEIILTIFLLAVSLFALVKSSDYFTKSAEQIGIWLKISPFIVGVTIVSIGTSLPELFSSIFAVLAGNSEIVTGNVIGSNVTNILLILGATAIVSKKIKITESFLRIDLMVFITSVFILVLISLNGVISFPETLILLVCLVTYLAYIINSKKYIERKDVKPVNLVQKTSKIKVLVILVFSILILFVSAKYTIDYMIELSKYFKIGAEIIAATVIALGTSLPELTVSINAARKGKSDIAIGNILGSNIFNIFAVVGISGLFGTLIIPTNMIIVGSLFMIVSTFLYFFSVKDREFTKWDGAFLIILYILYLIQIGGLA